MIEAFARCHHDYRSAIAAVLHYLSDDDLSAVEAAFKKDNLHTLAGQDVDAYLAAPLVRVMLKVERKRRESAAAIGVQA